MARRAVAPSPSRTRRTVSRLISTSRRFVIALAVLYPVGLVIALVLLYGVGESHWVTTLALYVPRIAFAAPLPVITLLLLLFRRHALLWTQLVALGLVVFPLMGFVPPWTVARADHFTVRVLSLNASAGQYGYEAIAREVEKVGPDIAFFQEVAGYSQPLLDALKARYHHVGTSTQFIVASRFPITETTEPPRLQYRSHDRSPRFMRYVITTPAGPIAFYSVHPASPRGVLQLHRFRGTFSRLRSGDLFEGDPAGDVGYNAGHRALQIEAVSTMAARETFPVVIVGDTNLPTLSKIFRAHLSRYEDGFRSAGSGFGYTFPAKYPWLRLDRILVSDALRVVSFGVGCPGTSDHLCVHAEIQAR